MGQQLWRSLLNLLQHHVIKFITWQHYNVNNWSLLQFDVIKLTFHLYCKVIKVCDWLFTTLDLYLYGTIDETRIIIYCELYNSGVSIIRTSISRQGGLCNINIKQVLIAKCQNKKGYFFLLKLSHRGSNNRKRKKLHRQRCWYCFFGGHFCSKNSSIFTKNECFWNF